MATWSGVVPDVDGLGIVAELLTRNTPHPLLWFSRYHHSLHNLALALVITVLAFVLAQQKWKTAALCFLGIHLHLCEALFGSRGPDGNQRPIPYLAPFSSALNLTWHGQWSLNAWPNFVITMALLGLTFYLAWARGYSPLEMSIGTRGRVNRNGPAKAISECSCLVQKQPQRTQGGTKEDGLACFVLSVLRLW